jgi:hypothetical protein
MSEKRKCATSAVKARKTISLEHLDGISGILLRWFLRKYSVENWTDMAGINV